MHLAKLEEQEFEAVVESRTAEGGLRRPLVLADA
jgi:hypothetical protein